MSRILQLQKFKRHLENRYQFLLEKSNNYRFIDESKSDIAAYKAMKLQGKINRIMYLGDS